MSQVWLTKSVGATRPGDISGSARASSRPCRRRCNNTMALACACLPTALPARRLLAQARILPAARWASSASLGNTAGLPFRVSHADAAAVAPRPSAPHQSR